MEIEFIVLVTTLVTVALFVIGVPVVLCLGTWSMITLYYTDVFPIANIGQSAFFGLKYFSLLAMPLFILTGDLISAGGISKRLIKFASTVLCKVPGRLGVTTIAACGLFAAISGSNSATTAAIGRIVIPEMTKKGYDLGTAAAISAAGGTVGVIIPPSLIFILYGVLMSLSPGDLFIAGIIPGVLMVAAMVLVSMILAKVGKTNRDGDPEAFSIAAVAKTGWDAKTGFLAIFIGLGGIYAGVFSPTEAAGVVVAYCLIAGIFMTREIKLKALFGIFFSSASITGMIAPIVAVSITVQETLSVLGMQEIIANGLQNIAVNETAMIGLIMSIIFISGCILESVPVVIIFAPILAPIVVAAGMNPIHFAVIFVVGSSIGFITPPYGLNLYMASGVSGAGIYEISKRIIPYVLALVLVWILIAVFPMLSLGILKSF